MFKRLIATVLLFTPGAVCAGDIALEWLDRSHQAVGGEAWDEVSSVRIHISVKLPGLEGEATSITDVSTGRFADQAELGPYEFADGFDGNVHWERDPSGQVQVQDSQGQLEATANERYRRMLAYWYRERWPASYGDLGSVSEAERSFQRIEITPEGGRTFELWIDEATGLIDRQVEKVGTRETIDFYTDYREVEGKMIAHRSRQREGDPRYDQTTQLLSIDFNVPVDEARFAMPAPPPPDYRFAGDATSTIVPFRLLNNHTYVEVLFNGQGPFSVILDTGGANVVTPQVAEHLGIDTQGELEVRGVGEQSQDMSLAQLESVAIGDATVDNQMFFVIDFDELSRAEGLAVDGLVGYEIFKRFVVRLDYSQSTLTLYDPGSYRYQGNGKPVKFQFDGGTPVVAGAIDGIAGMLTLDTGSRSHISLHAPFVENHGLLQKYPEVVEGITGWGVGGPARGRVLRGTSLRIGDDILIRDPVMSLSLQQRGAMTDHYQIANLGAGILSRFNLVFDYQQQVIWFESHAGSLRTDNYDRAGVWLNDVGDTFEVMGVITGGPAEEAGLQTGDQVLSVDGTASAELFLPDLRVGWRNQPVGSQVQLTVRRGDEVLEPVMQLRDLISPPRHITEDPQ